MPPSDYGPDLIAHFLLNELRAEGHIVQVERDHWVYQGPYEDYEVSLRVTPIPKTGRLREG